MAKEEIRRSNAGELWANVLLNYAGKIADTVEGTFYVVGKEISDSTMDVLLSRVCPAPEYNQSLLKVDRENRRYELLWEIPEKLPCSCIYKKEQEDLSDEERTSLEIYKYFDDRVFHKICQEENLKVLLNLDIGEEIHG